MATTNCGDCGGQVSASAEACPHCGRPMGKTGKPLLTKPAGVFVQLLGLFFLLASPFAFARGGALPGVLVALVAIGCFWLGRQTRPRNR